MPHCHTHDLIIVFQLFQLLTSMVISRKSGERGEKSFRLLVVSISYGSGRNLRVLTFWSSGAMVAWSSGRECNRYRVLDVPGDHYVLGPRIYSMTGSSVQSSAMSADH